MGGQPNTRESDDWHRTESYVTARPWATIVSTISVHLSARYQRQPTLFVLACGLHATLVPNPVCGTTFL